MEKAAVWIFVPPNTHVLEVCSLRVMLLGSCETLRHCGLMGGPYVIDHRPQNKVLTDLQERVLTKTVAIKRALLSLSLAACSEV
jgi:hypothetical protein